VKDESARPWLEVSSPLAWVLAAALLLRCAGLTWGLPASDGWDNDGIAPRDIWPGLIASFTQGQYFTYPPAHLALLAILTAPITLFVLARTSNPGAAPCPTAAPSWEELRRCVEAPSAHTLEV